MALDGNEKSLCNKLVSDFDKLIQPGRSAKGLVNGAANQMKSALNGMSFSDQTDLDNALDAYRDDIASQLPGDSVDDLNKIKQFIDGCDYLKDLSPVSALIGTIGGIYDTIDNLINSLDLSFPEFGVGGLGSLIDKILDGIPGIPGSDKIADLLAKADKLLDCLSNSCAAVDPTYIGDLSQKTDELQQVYDDLGVIDDPNDPNYGKFNYDAMYNELGLSTSEISAIDKVKSGVNASKDAGNAAVSSATNAMKSAIKGGLF